VGTLGRPERVFGQAILEESILAKRMPEWNKLQLTWDELNDLPNSWKQAISQWRGVYFILDGADGKGYVGSACGEQNLYGRWKNYAESGDGGNTLLRERAPGKFRFPMLQLVSPSDTKDEVTQLENNWKDRLHTREFGLNAN
jgi:GIY-YIG catalytic domain